MSKILWIAKSNSAQAYYRCALPANALDQDWAGYNHLPPGFGGVMQTGNIYRPPVIEDYENIVVQMVRGDTWLEAIKSWQKIGIKVYYEIDDFVHGVSRIKDHRFRQSFNKKAVKEYEAVMKVCDGIICSTPFLANQYKKYNSNIHVCHNYIDTPRYDIEKPDNGDNIILGWSGGTGHTMAMKTWFTKVYELVGIYSNLKFISSGARYGDELAKYYPDKSMAVPWTQLENHPYQISIFDIAMAPSHDSKYFKSKSDLRWLESAAIGIPVIANPITYPYIEDGVTGLLANTAEEFEHQLDRLIASKDLREEIAGNAKEFVKTNRDIRGGCQAWVEVFEN